MLAVAAMATGCSSQPSESDQAGTLRLAVTDLQGLEELQREFGAFKDEFEKYSGLNLEYFAVNNRTAAAAALEADRIDVVFTGPAEYVVIHEKTRGEPIVAIERDGYRSCIYTTADSGISTLAQLRGKKIAMTDIGSTSGHLGPSQMLVDVGIDPQSDDVNVIMVGDAVHQALKRGDVDAVGLGCQDYDEFMADEDDPSQFPVIEKGPTLPPDLLMAREGLDPTTIELVRDTFTDNFDALLAAMLEGKDNAKYENAKLVQVTNGDYDVVRKMYNAIGVDDFSEFVGN